MKLIVAVVHDEDSHDVVERLTENGYGVTKLASTGGFLRSGNTTMFIGVEKEKVDDAIEIIKDTCKSRKEIAPAPAPIMGNAGLLATYPVEVKVGGATIFVLDVDRFEKA